MSEFHFQTELRDGIPVIHLFGDIDIRSAAMLKDVLLGAAQFDAGAVVVSMRETAYFDSSTIFELSIFGERVRQNRQSLIIVLPALPSALSILTICGLPQRYPCYTTLEEAVSAAVSPSPNAPGKQ